LVIKTGAYITFRDTRLRGWVVREEEKKTVARMKTRALAREFERSERLAMQEEMRCKRIATGKNPTSLVGRGIGSMANGDIEMGGPIYNQ
jgi:hypothetical protein